MLRTGHFRKECTRHPCDSSLLSKEALVKVEDIKTRAVNSVKSGESIAHAARSMAENDVGMLPVIDETDLLGIVTDRDIAVRALAAGINPSSPIRRIMSEDIATCSPNDDVEEALETMANEQVRWLPVCDDRDRVIGVLGLADAAMRDSEPSEVTEKFAEICQDTGLHCQAPVFA
jgi:CBS domain-containing protein